MSKIQFQACGRSMRWYEWAMMLLLLGLAAGVRAESVYKCIDAQGAIAYQALACPSQQQQTMIAIAPPPAHVVAPDYAIAKSGPVQRAHADRNSRHGATQLAQMSYECHVADGQVFYRHSPCPHSVSADAAGGGKRRGRSASQKLSVSAHAVAREEACMQMHRAGAIGRAGHQHDEDVSTYERNLGRDPCK